MNQSIVRHILTALGAVLAFLGLGKFTGFIELLVQHLDTVWAAVTAIIGAVTAWYGYWKGRATGK